MDRKKTLLFLLLFFLILNSVFVIYLANFRYYVFNENYYKKQFERNNVYNKLPEADKALDNLFLFFKNNENLNDDFFNENERAHLQDVKVLIDKVIVTFYISIFLEILLIILLFFLVKKRFKKYLAFVLLYSGGLILLISVLFYFFSNNFQYLFIKFHEIFFPQGNWLFSYNSNLIVLFPQQFFYDFFYKIIISAFIVSLFIFTLGLLLSLKEK